jgi:carboxylesterase type B
VEPPPGGWPVIVWLHGGWVQSGNAMVDPRHHPHELISKNGFGLNAVVVAPAYRVNVFGFLGASEEGLGGNWGFWDQRCALEWVAEHIKYFGGDPENVTLGGVSAG